MARKLTRKGFEEWLMEVPDAKAGSLCECPIEVFRHKENFVVVYEKLPKWAQRFVTAIDAFADINLEYPDWSLVTREDALEILRGIK